MRDREKGLVRTRDDASNGPSEGDDSEEDRADRRAGSKGRDGGVNDQEESEEEETGLDDTEAQKAAKRDTWRPMLAGGYAGVIPAVRMVGEKDKKAFACVFVILASR